MANYCFPIFHFCRIVKTIVQCRKAQPTKKKMPLCDCTKPSVGKDCLRYFLLPAYSYTYLQKLQKNLSQKPFFNMNKISSDISKIEVTIIYYVCMVSF